MRFGKFDFGTIVLALALFGLICASKAQGAPNAIGILKQWSDGQVLKGVVNATVEGDYYMVSQGQTFSNLGGFSVPSPDQAAPDSNQSSAERACPDIYAL